MSKKEVASVLYLISVVLVFSAATSILVLKSLSGSEYLHRERFLKETTFINGTTSETFPKNTLHTFYCKAVPNDEPRTAPPATIDINNALSISGTTLGFVGIAVIVFLVAWWYESDKNVENPRRGFYTIFWWIPNPGGEPDARSSRIMRWAMAVSLIGITVIAIVLSVFASDAHKKLEGVTPVSIYEPYAFSDTYCEKPIAFLKIRLIFSLVAAPVSAGLICVAIAIALYVQANTVKDTDSTSDAAEKGASTPLAPEPTTPTPATPATTTPAGAQMYFFH